MLYQRAKIDAAVAQSYVQISKLSLWTAHHDTRTRKELVGGPKEHP